MKCRILKLSYLLLPVFFFSAFLSFCSSPTVSAIEDYVYTITQDTSYQALCSNSLRPCSDYSYISIEFVGDLTTMSSSSNVMFGWQGNQQLFLTRNYPFVTISLSNLPPSSNPYFGITGSRDMSNFFSNSGSIVVTLSDHACPVCEECQECQECEECQECPEGGGACNYDEKFDGVITAIYTCGAVALVIYFFYCIYRMIIGTSGSWK